MTSPETRNPPTAPLHMTSARAQGSEGDDPESPDDIENVVRSGAQKPVEGTAAQDSAAPASPPVRRRG
ncbi:MAG TPA: hypothetical protein PKI03_12390 [Pseudomonadota bacterium]|nr:hypothetical protein [Pseudomonadota bacterium]